MDRNTERTFQIRCIEPGATYLTAGETYTVTREGGYLHFRNNRTGSGTFERVRMWNLFIELGRVKIEASERIA